MKRLYWTSVFVVLILAPAIAFSAGIPKLVGQWGYANIQHSTGDNSWHSEAGTLVFNNNGTGAVTYKYNDKGSLNTGTNTPFTYTVTPSGDGSAILSISISGSTKRFIMSDDGKMFIEDGTFSTGKQKMQIGIRMDPSRTYSAADLNGSYCSISYEHDINGYGFFQGSPYNAYSHIDTFDGLNTISSNLFWNAYGTMSGGSVNNHYSLGSDGTMQVTESNYIGYGSGFGEIGTGAAPAVASTWQIHGTMKRGDKNYSTSDLAGTWVISGFGDDGGTSFNSFVSSMTCDSNGNCVHADRNQTDGSLKFGSHGFKLAVSADGSFGSSVNSADSGAPSYTAAIGNNGNTIMFNGSFDTSDTNSREIVIGLKCSGCFNIGGWQIPMWSPNIDQYGNMNGMNLYTYNPSTQTIATIKENSNISGWPNLNRTQTLAVYTDGPGDDFVDEPIYLYNIAAAGSQQINGRYARWESAFFDRNDYVLFLDNSDGNIKRMDTSGNILSAISPAGGYYFAIFWLSPDKNTIAAVEEKRGGDYYTTNYDHIVVMDAATGSRISTSSDVLGEWNMITWKPDSSAFLYYYHSFDGSGNPDHKTPKYALYTNIAAASPAVNDLSGADLGHHDNNILVFTKWGNLLSLTYQQLYNGQTGALISTRSDIPAFNNMMVGFDGAGEIYFAHRDKTNFSRFLELGATSCLTRPVQDGASTYSLILDAYNAASPGDSIQLQANDFIENLNLQRNIAIRLQGGYDCSYSSNSAFSTIHGDLMISNGTVTVDSIIVQ